MEQADDAVRVMTVHGAKGLEAKIVFLPDTCATPFRSKPPALFEIADPAFAGAPPFLAWSARRDDDPPAVAAARAAAMAAAADEHRRLLYVALTRAQERLYIAGFAGTKETPDDCWHKMIEASLGRDMESFPAPWPGRDMVKRRAENWPPGGEAPVEPAQADFFTSEDFLFSPAPPERVADPPLRPSHALAAAGQPESDNLPARPFALAPQGLIAGRLMHRLLQHLPDTAPARRLQAASRFLEARGAGLSADNRQRLARAALEVIDDPRLSALFGPGSRAEAAIAGTLARESGAPLAVSGQIDRLAVTGDEVLIADFKTGAPPGGGAAPAPYVAQLALYRAVMATIHPGLPIRAFLIWTSGPEVVEIAPEALDHALAMVRADTAS